MKERLDVLLVKRNLAESREKAKAIIMSGNVFVEGQREDKAGTTFSDEVQIEIKGHTLPYVSRGGLKLEKAVANFDVCLEGKVCTWALRLVVLQTVCCKTGQEKCLPLMSEKDSLRGN
jgi:23S rRNA (cytidine1920-2'-O)/16S rRNA (cytidine1409-2'-O)-methyltransferase